MREIRPSDAARLQGSLTWALRHVRMPEGTDAEDFSRQYNEASHALEAANESAGYNGWTNYETWNVNLWLSNDDEGTYNAVREIVREKLEEEAPAESPSDSEDWRRRMRIGNAGEAVKQFVEELRPDLGASMFEDLLGAALSSVDWYAVAEAFAEV